MTSGSAEKDRGWNNALETAAKIVEDHLCSSCDEKRKQPCFSELAAEIREKKSSERNK